MNNSSAQLHEKIQRLRKEYSLSGLLEDHAALDPVQQFQSWFDNAVNAGLSEPNAMIVSTVGADNRPSSRAVLMKHFDQQGFVFFSNYHSRKGNQIDTNPWVAAVFLWSELERQVRIEGKVQKTDRKTSETYFHSRPREAQLSAASSSQSEVVVNREKLEAQRTHLEVTIGTQEIPCPASWGGYVIVPDRFEFWQGRAGRLHDRLEYLKKDKTWLRQRLAP